MHEISLSSQQVAVASKIGREVKAYGYVLIPYEDFGQHFGSDSAEQLRFLLSSNAWKIKLDELLGLVVITQETGKVATWPIEDLKRQIAEMKRRGVAEEDRK